MGVCNAAESLLVHRDVAATFLPDIAAALREHEVEIVGMPLPAAFCRRRVWPPRPTLLINVPCLAKKRCPDHRAPNSD